MSREIESSERLEFSERWTFDSRKENSSPLVISNEICMSFTAERTWNKSEASRNLIVYHVVTRKDLINEKTSRSLSSG